MVRRLSRPARRRPWSDVDLIVVTDDEHVGKVCATNDECARLGSVLLPSTNWRATVFRGTTYASVVYITDEMPLWVDLHVHGASHASRPRDAAVAFARPGMRLADDELDFTGVQQRLKSRGPTVPPDPTELGAAERDLALVPIAAKWIARGAPNIGSMIDLVHGVRPDTTEWRDEISALRDVVDRCRTLASPKAVAAVDRYLNIVERWRAADSSGARP